ncbi:DnaT-like ssDNA-binding protein [Roseovarius sp. MMSF_3281]|uniref:DnaT-like ssDNA-binding protein n=1 Tax=Roseovarius sp. MMSF_3281 TaxID=3046694 RepID=UPI00273F0665|nr:DnaT-like ssDNA-binding protein [Roseovarius sp. MMSF_3281]
MALTVEDGTGLSNANAFVSLAEFKAFCDLRGHSYTTDPLIEQAIVRATDFMSNSWAWDGFKRKGRGNADGEQALAFPRTDLVDRDGYAVPYDSVPQEIKDATIEVARVELTTPGAMTPTYTPHERVKSEKVGPLSTVYDLSSYDAEGARPVILAVRDLIGAFLKNGGQSKLSGETMRV